MAEKPKIRQYANPKAGSRKQSIDLQSELLIRRVKEFLIENQNYGIQLKLDTKGQKINRDHRLYRPKRDARGRVKQFNRTLGELLTTNPKDQKDLLKLIEGKDLVNNPGELGDSLFKFLKSRDTQLVYVKGKARDWTVGHHPTATNILRDALSGPLQIGKNGLIKTGEEIFTPRIASKTRRELEALAKKRGYNISAAALAYIDPAAHKEFTTKINGILSRFPQYFGPQADPKGKYSELFIEMVNKSAHAKPFGGNSGVPINPALIKPGMSAEEIFDIAKPYLDLAKAGTNYGLDGHQLIRNSHYDNPDELLKIIKSRGAPNTDALLQPIFEQLDKANLPVPTSLINSVTDPNLLPPHLRKRYTAKPFPGDKQIITPDDLKGPYHGARLIGATSRLNRDQSVKLNDLGSHWNQFSNNLNQAKNQIPTLPNNLNLAEATTLGPPGWSQNWLDNIVRDTGEVVNETVGNVKGVTEGISNQLKIKGLQNLGESGMSLLQRKVVNPVLGGIGGELVFNKDNFTRDIQNNPLSTLGRVWAEEQIGEKLFQGGSKLAKFGWSKTPQLAKSLLIGAGKGGLVGASIGASLYGAKVLADRSKASSEQYLKENELQNTNNKKQVQALSSTPGLLGIFTHSLIDKKEIENKVKKSFPEEEDD